MTQLAEKCDEPGCLNISPFYEWLPLLQLTQLHGQLLQIIIIIVRLHCYIRGDVHYCSERQPGCRRAAADYQRLDRDAEEGNRRFGVVQQELGGVS